MGGTAPKEERPRGPDPVLVRTFREVMGAGGCRNPVHLLAETVDTETGEILTTDLRIACKDRRSVLCPSCAAVYKADAWFLVTAGLAGGKGMPETLAQHPRLFLTLTAPSFGMVHTTSSDGGCHTNKRTACPHGQPRTCTIRHEPSDDRLGSPLCEACFDWEGAVLWNAAASRLWNRTIDRVRRVLAAEVGGITAFRRQASLQYLRVAEFQRRGLVHLHAVIRADGPAPTDPPPAWLTVELLERAVRGAVASTSVPTGAGTTATWGKQLDLVDLGSTEGDAARVAGYVAKYATKTTDGDFGLARRFRTRREVALARTTRHLHLLADCAWDLGGRPELEELRLRAHAHTLGFTGQLVTKSRGFSTTFGALRAVRATFAAAEHDPAPIDASYAYVDRGYSDPRAETLTELLVGIQAEGRKARRLRRLEQQAEAESGPPPTVG